MEEKSVSNDSVGALFLGEEPEQPAEEPVEESPEILEADTEEEVEQDEQTEELDASDADEQEDEPDGSEFVEVEYDGQLYEVPPQLKDALLRQSDYTQKTQAIAQQQKQYQALMETAQQQQAAYQFTQEAMPQLMEANNLEQQAKQYNEFLRDNIDTLNTSDIEKIRWQIQDVKEKREELLNGLNSKHQEFQQAQQQSHQELLNKGTEILRQRIPSWGKEAQQAVRNYALESGYTEAEISGVADPRMVETLWKASQYDQLQAGKTSAVKRVEGAPKIKPKTRKTMSQDTQDKLNLRKKMKSDKLSPREKQALAAQDIAQRWT